MTSTVDRTFVINFKAVPSRLKCADISDFMVQKLNFLPTQVKHLQIINGRVYVGTESPEVAQNMVQTHNMQHELEHDGKLYRIPLSMEDGTIEVRMQDIRPKITNHQLVQRMTEYGQIHSVREEIWKDFWPGVPSGVRILRMILSKPIPSYVYIDTERSLVTYRGQVATCKHCNRNVHFTQTCSEYAKSLRSSVNDRLTLATIVKNSNAESNVDAGDSAGTSFDPYVDFTEVKRARRSKTNKTVDKNTQRDRSKSAASIASQISISSAELPTETPVGEDGSENTMFPEFAAASTSNNAEDTNEMDTADTNGIESPPFFGFPDVEQNNSNNKRKQPAAKNTDKGKQTTQPTPRSRSSSRTKPKN